VTLIGIASANNEEVKTTELNKQIQDYTAEADALILKLVSDSSADSFTGLAIGALVTDHFGGRS
jgi:hypothetical protein